MLRIASFLLILLTSTQASTMATGDSKFLTDWEFARPGLQTLPMGSRSTKAAIVPPVAEETTWFDPRWRFGLHYFQGTTSDFTDIVSGNWDPVSQNGLRLTAGMIFHENLWNLPIDLGVEAGMMWHDEKSAAPSTYQWTLAFKIEWTRFPWSDCLRTRFGFGTGLSYAENIPVAEIKNRGTDSSQHLLHYLELNLAFNCSDILDVTRINRLFGGFRHHALDDVWLVVATPHRSGAWGLFGDDRYGQEIRGGSNYFSFGLEAEF